MDDREGPRWLNYREAAAVLGMTPESLRARARRESWRRTIGNDGKALVLVPPDTASNPAASREDAPPAARSAVRPEPVRDTALTETLGRLAAAQAALLDTTCRLGQAEGAVAALRETVAALKAALASSEDRAAQIRAERDRVLTAVHLREQRRWYRRLVGG